MFKNISCVGMTCNHVQVDIEYKLAELYSTQARQIISHVRFTLNSVVDFLFFHIENVSYCGLTGPDRSLDQNTGTPKKKKTDIICTFSCSGQSVPLRVH